MEYKGIKLTLDMETKEFDSAINRVANSTKVFDNDIKKLKQNLKLEPDSIRQYNVMVDTLRKKFSETSNAVDFLKKALNEALDSGKINEYSSEYVNLSNQILKLENNLQITDKDLNALTADWEENGRISSKTLDDLNKNIVTANGNIDEMGENSSNAGSRLAEFGSNILSTSKIIITHLVTKALQLATRELKKLGEEALRTGIEFTSLSSQLEALYYGDLGDGEFQNVIDKVRELGTTTLYSANDIANAMTDMAKAGYNAQESLDSVIASLNLSQATGEDVASVSNILVDGLHAFGLEADQAQRFADVLAVAANETNVDVADLGESFKYAGSLAGSFGLSIEDVAAALATMGQQGVKGSQAGTTLRQMLVRLSTNTSHAREVLEGLGVAFYDVEGNVRPLNEILSGLREALKGASDETIATTLNTIAGQRAISGLSAIINTNEEDWNSLTEAIANANGVTQKISEIRMDNLAGDVEILKNNFSEIGLQLYDHIEEPLRGIADDLLKVLQSEEFQQFIDFVGERLGEIIDDISEWLEEDSTKQFFKDVAGIVTDLVEIASELGIIEAAIWLVETAAKAVKLVLDKIKEIVDWLSGKGVRWDNYVPSEMPTYYDEQGNPLNYNTTGWGGSGGYGALQSGGFTSNLTINVNTNQMITEQQVRGWASIINEELGQMV